ncbi:hypothetical protein ACJX0J_012547, partial [Zea mays]
VLVILLDPHNFIVNGMLLRIDYDIGIITLQLASYRLKGGKVTYSEWTEVLLQLLFALKTRDEFLLLALNGLNLISITSDNCLGSIFQ